MPSLLADFELLTLIAASAAIIILILLQYFYLALLIGLLCLLFTVNRL
jgi:hypothetical protein